MDFDKEHSTQRREDAKDAEKSEYYTSIGIE
jgi:hypothetical protein